MKFILLGIIKLYWKVIPEYKRRNCVFTESCSQYVYRITKEKGTISGLVALKQRFYKCRPGYILYFDRQNNSFELFLKNGSTIKEEEISSTLLPPYNNYYVEKINTQDFN